MAVWQRMDGEPEPTALTVHPDGDLVVRRIVAGVSERAGVYHRETGDAVWCPSDVTAIDWSSDGERVAVVTEGAATGHDLVWGFELRRWPDRELVAACALRPPTGWPDRVQLSPRGDLAAISYTQQGEQGLELVDLGTSGAEQLRGRGWRPGGPFAFVPRFTPSGRRLVAGSFHRLYWLTDLPSADVDSLPMPHEEPARGGLYHAARVAVFDCDDRTHRIFDVDVELPEGFLPEEDRVHGAIDAADVLDDERLWVRFVTGDELEMEIAPRQ